MPFLEDGNKGFPMIEAEKDQNDFDMSIVEAYILRGILPSFRYVYDLAFDQCLDVEDEGFHDTHSGHFLQTIIYDFS